MCKICKGQFKKPCMFCGMKKLKGDRQKRREPTRAERREDYLGSIYNAMRKYHMPTTGLIADVEGMTVLIQKFVDDSAFVIVDDSEEAIEIPRADLINIRKNDVDIEVLAKIGDPLIGSQYTPYRKLKKNEV